MQPLDGTHHGHHLQSGKAARYSAPAGDQDAMDLLAAHYFRTAWSQRSITTANIDAAEAWAAQSSKYSCAGAWRAKIVRGKLWVKMIKVEPHWSERASVLQLLRKAIAHGTVGDADFVYIHSDRDPNRGYMPCARCTRVMIPLLGNAHQRPSNTLPVPDYSWVGWATHTPPWCERYRSMAAAGLLHPFESRTDRAFFSGGMRTGSARNMLKTVSHWNVAQKNNIFELRQVAPKFHTTKCSFLESNWDLLFWNRIGTCYFGIELGPAIMESNWDLLFWN
jgi:hypothetical protein